MAHFDRILRGGAVVDPVNGLAGETMDIALKDGRVAEVAPHVEGSADEVEDLTGLTVMPGLIDPHLHLGTSFGSPYGTRMAALAGVTTCLDMAGPVADILKWAPQTGSGINVAMLEGFSPKALFGTLSPTCAQIRSFVQSAVASGAIGVKLMGGHWPLPLETCRMVVEEANDLGFYVAWHAGSTTAGSDLKGMIEAVETAKGYKLHLAHINAYCRGRVKDAAEESRDAVQMLIDNPNIWSESYVSPLNGTMLACGPDGTVIDHVTQNCLHTFGLPPTADGLRTAFRTGRLYAIRDSGVVSELIAGADALAYWEKAGTDCAGSFPVNPAISRLAVASAKRPDGTFAVDAISTDGGCIPRNVTLAVGLSLVKFGALTLSEFVVKASVAAARHLRLADRGHLTPGKAAADVTVFDYERQRAVETIVGGRTVMKDGKLFGSGLQFVTTKAGQASLEAAGWRTILTDFSGDEPARFRLA